MGQHSIFQMQFEEKVSFLQTLFNSLSKSNLPEPLYVDIVEDLEYILNIFLTMNLNDVKTVNLITSIVDKSFLKQFSPLLDLPLFNLDDKSLKENGATDLLIKLSERLTLMKISLMKYLDKSKTIYNSEEYYIDKIDKLEAQKKELENAVENQINIKENELISNKIELQNAIRQIDIYKKELEEKKQQEDNIRQWEEKIKRTFSEFRNHLKPIEDEQKRLSKLYITYIVLAAITLSLLLAIEITLFLKLNNTCGLPQWKDYFAALAPIPVLAGLLWASITQINRNQRHLLILANHIHEVNYIEGLLLATNALSSDVKTSAERVNSAIDKLLEKHLDKLSSNVIDENRIISEERKDVVPIDILIKVLKEAKGIISK